MVCYFSAGSGENWRPDYASFKAADLGNALDGRAGEKWLDTRSTNVQRRNKPVFNAEYTSKWHTSASARATMCTKARAQNLRTLVLPLALDDSFRYTCD